MRCGASTFACPQLPHATMRAKKWTTNITIATFFLIGGVEYSVIFPTMWDYMNLQFGAEEWLYGLSLAAFSISNLFMGPVFGYVFDRTHRTKLIVLFANLFEIGGNFMYFAAQSKYMVLGSRFIVGVGAGAGAAIFGDLARTSTKKERTFIFSIFISMRQIGIIIGPAFNFFLRICKFKIGPFPVSKYTAPGAFMMLLWILIELIFVVFYFQLPPAVETVEETQERGKKSSSINTEVRTNAERRTDNPSSFASTVGMVTPIPSPISFLHEEEEHCNIQITQQEGKRPNSNPSLSLAESHSDEDDKETTPLLSNGVAVHVQVSAPSPSDFSSYGSLKSDSSVSKVESEVHTRGNTRSKKPLWWKLLRGPRHFSLLVWELIKEETVVLLVILFMTMFNQTAIETVLVPLAEKLLDWHEKETSIFYSAAGLEIIIVLVLVTVLTRVIEDRWQLLVGLIAEVFAYAWLTGLIGNASRDTPWVLWRVIIGGFFIIFGLPFFAVAGAGLYSKFLPMHIQGFGQGIRRSVFSVAAILGPLWAGGGLGFKTYYVLFGVPLGLIMFVNVLTLLSFTRLKESHKTTTANASQSQK